jgi:protein-L-isoaspartate O-methyltransferase
VGSSYGATTEVPASLIAQLHSQGKLTTPRRVNRKIRHEIEILKTNECYACVQTSDLSNDTNKSGETIPLIFCLDRGDR